MAIEFTLNGNLHSAQADPGETLLDVLRSSGVTSVKRGCDYGECGSCGVLVDGRAQNACLLLLHAVQDKQVETVESLASQGKFHPIQRSFLDAGAIQCGYCTPGMILSVEALLRARPRPDTDQVRDALAGNLCRCTGYVKPVQAVVNLARASKG